MAKQIARAQKAPRRRRGAERAQQSVEILALSWRSAEETVRRRCEGGSGSNVTGIRCHHQRALFSSSPLSLPKVVSERSSAASSGWVPKLSPLRWRKKNSSWLFPEECISPSLSFYVSGNQTRASPASGREGERARGVRMGGVKRRRGRSDAPKQRS